MTTIQSIAEGKETTWRVCNIFGAPVADHDKVVQLLNSCRDNTVTVGTDGLNDAICNSTDIKVSDLMVGKVYTLYTDQMINPDGAAVVCIDGEQFTFLDDDHFDSWLNTYIPGAVVYITARDIDDPDNHIECEDLSSTQFWVMYALQCIVLSDESNSEAEPYYSESDGD
jgi:hypothetical protein